MIVIDHQFAHQFLTKFVHAWVVCDADAAIELVTENFRNVWDPIRPPVQGRDGYRKLWIDEGGNQEDLDISWRDPMVQGNMIFAEMWATMIYHGAEMSNPESGKQAEEANIKPSPVTAVGCSTFEFDEVGLCFEIREYRSVSPGLHQAPPAYRHRMTARDELAALGVNSNKGM